MAARAAKKAERLVEAVVHYDELARALRGGALPPGISPEEAKAASAEHATLASDLDIELRGPSGKADAVVGRVLATAKKVFAERKKRKPALEGKVQFVVQTDEAGAVEDVVIKDDTLGDPRVAAAIVGNLRRATIKGGAKSYAFTMEFQ